LAKYTPMLVEKNYRWIWIAVDRYGKLFISFVCGDKSTLTGLKLWDRLKRLKINRFTSDYWKSYEDFVPVEKHLQSKNAINFCIISSLLIPAHHFPYQLHSPNAKTNLISVASHCCTFFGYKGETYYTVFLPCGYPNPWDWDMGRQTRILYQTGSIPPTERRKTAGLSSRYRNFLTVFLS